MTLNQVIRRLELICVAHKQVRNFYYGLPTDFLTEKTTRYASAFLQDTPGSLELGTKTQLFGFKLFLLDLVHVSEGTKQNERDVQSDMLSVIKDLAAEFNHSSYTDWKLSLSNPVTLVSEGFDDMVAGATIDISISTPYEQDVCAVPTEPLPGVINTDDMKLVYDEIYVATGSEGTTLSIPAIIGKKVLMIIRANNPIHKVSNLPEPDQYTWNNTSVGLGTPTSVPGERFLILYRNY